MSQPSHRPPARPEAMGRPMTFDDPSEVLIHRAGQTAGTVPTVQSVPPVKASAVIASDLREWLGRFIRPLSPLDLDLLTLWVLHTHFVDKVFWTTPRLLLDSAMPGAGKTTVLEHVEKLGFQAVQMSAVSSPALLTRMLADGMRTLLIDETDRTLRADKPGVEDIIAIINTGYKRGATRPVLVQGRNGKWKAEPHPTFAPVALAGRSNRLPDDTMTRTLTVTLIPDNHGVVEDSDWEVITPEVRALAGEIAAWATAAEASVRGCEADLPEGVRGRAKERWRPLLRVAQVCGPRWIQACHQLIARETAEMESMAASGASSASLPVVLLRDIIEVWPVDKAFWATRDILAELRSTYPERWGSSDKYPKGLTEQRLGGQLGKGLRLHSSHNPAKTMRGFYRDEVFRMGEHLKVAPMDGPDSPDGVGGSERPVNQSVQGAEEPRTDTADELNSTAIEHLGLPVRTCNALKAGGIHTVGDLTARREMDLVDIRDLGQISLLQVTDKLRSLGLNLKDDPPLFPLDCLTCHHRHHVGEPCATRPDTGDHR